MSIISVEPVVVAESAGFVPITLTLDQAFAQDITVTMRIVAQTANPETDIDFDQFSAVLQVIDVTIPAGQTSLVVNAYTKANADLADENFTIELTDPVNATLAGNVDVLRVTGVITEGARALFVSDPTILEGDSGQKNAVFEIRISEAAATPLTFDYATLNGTATAGSDFAARSGSVTFAAGQTVKFVSVPINGDTAVENWETFSLVVTPTGGTASNFSSVTADNVGTAIIRDNDTASALPVLSIEPATGPESAAGLVYVARISEVFAQDVTVSVRVVGQTADPQTDADFTRLSGIQQIEIVRIPAGQTTAEFTIEHAVNADLADENYVLEVTDPVNAVLAGDVDVLQITGVITEGKRGLFVSDPTLLEGDSGQKEAIFEVRLSEAASVAMNFTYKTIDGSAQAGSDYLAKTGTLGFVPGQTVAYVRVPVLGDTVSEASESFSLVVTPDTGTQQQLFDPFADNVGTAILRDDDAPGVQPVLTIEPSVGPESAGGQGFALRLSKPFAQDASVTVRIVGQTADPNSDADFTSFSSVLQTGTVTIRAGETTSEFFVFHNVNADQADENYILELTDPVNAVLEGGVDVLRVTGVITEGKRALFVSDPTLLEGDAGQKEAVFEIRLSEPANAALQMSYTTRDGSAQAGQDYQAVSGTIIFDAGQTVAYVRVPVFGDTTIEDFETFGLLVTPNATALPLLNNPFSDNFGIATLRDDDTTTALPVLSMESASGAEGAGGQSFVLRLSRAFAQDVAVDLTIVGQSADPATDADFDFFSAVQTQKTVIIPAGQTSFAVFVDQKVNADSFDENYVIKLTNPVNAVLAGGGNEVQVTAVIEDGVRSLFVSDPVVREIDGPGKEAVFEVRLSMPAAQSLTFDYNTVNGTAVAGQDFTARSGTLTFLAGETLAYVRVPVLGDTINEANETFSLSVVARAATAPLVPGALADNVGVALILNDDGANAAPTGSVTISGLAIKGETLSADATSLADADGLGALTFQWLRGGTAIVGATGSTYVATAADVGAALRVSVSYTDGGGTAEAVQSAATTAVVTGLTLNGTAGPDTLDGSAGDDRLTGFAANDLLRGNAGNDTLLGGDGTDTLNGGDGNDSIIGGTSTSDLRDVIFAGAGNDFVDGGYGNDDINGMGGNDTLAGGFGVDTVVGGDGDDVMTGSAFSDLVFGNDGNDFVNGGFGNDRVNGGAGADKFFHLGVAGHGSDWIQDFSNAEGDVLVFGGTGAKAADFQVNFANNGSGDASVDEAFVIYKPTGQILWALVDGAGEASIDLQIGAGNPFDLLN